MKLLTPVHLPLWIFLLSLASFVTNSKGSEVIRVSEGSDVILPCSLKESVVQRLFVWRKDGQKENKEEVFMYDAGLHYNNGLQGQAPQFRGRVSHFEDQLKFGNASIKIINTTITDSGNYTCVFPYVNGGLRFNIKLVVDTVLKDRSGEILGAASKPTITRINVTDAWIQLRCAVVGAFPKPELRWKDSDGNILDAEDPEISERKDGRYDISLQTTVTSTRTNWFQCVVHQKDLNHETGSNITVSEKLFVDKCRKVTTAGFLSGEVTIGGMMTGVVLGALLLAAVLVLLLAFKFITIRRVRGKKKDDDHEAMKPLNSNPVTV